MSSFSAVFFFIVMYAFGWLLYVLPQEQLMFYVMGLFVIINAFTVFNPLIFHNGVMRPLQLSLSSSGLLSLFMGNTPIFTFSLFLVLTLLLIENEDIGELIVEGGPGTIVKRVIATLFLPFSVTYVVMIFRPSDEIYYLLVIMFYFSVLFFSSKWFDNITSFSFFMIFQMVIFVYIIEQYFDWSSLEITMFFISVFIFLLIGYGRKGLLSYSSNIK